VRRQAHRIADSGRHSACAPVHVVGSVSRDVDGWARTEGSCGRIDFWSAISVRRHRAEEGWIVINFTWE
jgi:hypothetical protein